ncbi:nose resistant to fluoxetine protein 6-like [Tribolium madens]|uniref:nose resistant to fluoxetine protein 6-like n=1 Tax=Tribolium madens TaxID=41895 RepID=UPI001CF74B4A|nr:nose resistant to fluoxetine protein 6-like [Tribolium madens]
MRKTLLSLLSASAMILVIKGEISENTVFPSLPVAVLETNNSLCKRQSEMYIQNLENFTLWAHEMWDATAKSATGVLRGSIFQMGHFEECLTAKAPFLTKYCLTQLTANVPNPRHHTDPISLYHDPYEHVSERLYPYKDKSQQPRNIIQVGWCIPASCSPEESEKFLNSYINDIDLPLLQNNVTYNAHISEITCHTKLENSRFLPADYCFCTLATLLCLLVIVSTLCDFNASEEKDEKPAKKSSLYSYLMAFSARKNFNELTKIDESNSALRLLYGIRTLCIFCIILDHRFGTFTSAALLNFDYVETQYRAPLAPFLFHGDLFVDTFFVLGGLLVCYGLLNQYDKKKVNPAFIILMRYIRLTPVYAFVIFYYATVFNYTGSGPLWKLIAGQDSQDCKDHWWINLLYLSNYVKADHVCMAHSWYLPCDFHYFIIAIFVCLLIKKDKKFGLGTLLLLVVVSTLIPFAITLVYQRPALLHFYPEFLTGPKSHYDFLLTYIKSHTRATPYFIGMFAGYVYYKLQGKNTHVCRIRSHFLMLLSLIMILVCIVGGAVFYDPYHKYNALESSVYAALHRPAFAIGTVGIIYVSSYGHATFINKILCWSPWIPLSKLVYGVYLIHMQFQLRAASKFMNPRQFSYFDVICLSVGDTLLSFLAAIALYLLVEAPFRKIFRQLLMPNRVSPPETKAESRENVSNGVTDSRL